MGGGLRFGRPDVTATTMRAALAGFLDRALAAWAS
jgi:hypothetical protein